MSKQFCFTGVLLYACIAASAQFTVAGTVVDRLTNAPVAGATIQAAPTTSSTLTNQNGKFSLLSDTRIDSLLVSMAGYKQKKLVSPGHAVFIGLEASFSELNELIISANRETQQRVEAPVAIQVISKATMNDTKATRLDMLLNKVPGVFMVDLGNEQHSMSIRQPLGYNNVFLYLEDGIPIRTIGDFNHNALIEINQAATEKIEVIKGPASSLYGSEAVGGAVNFISQSPSQLLAAKLQVEGGSLGYRRADFFVSNTYKKLGLYAGGYYANQDQSANLHNDFRKSAIKLRADYSFDEKTKLVNTIDLVRYKTDQKGGLDSSHFYGKNYTSLYRFTYRKVDALRIKSSLSHEWNVNNKTSFSVFFRNTSIGQNPFYSISNVAGNNAKARGLINEDAFQSYGSIVQHIKKFNFLKAKLIAGLSADFSPAIYIAHYTDVDRDNNGVYTGYRRSDSLLTDYQVNLLNTAAYAQFEINPIDRLKMLVAARYDRMDYRFDNHLPATAFTGSPDTENAFQHFTPKLGLTYDLANHRGLYANYSVGFAPPNITDLYQGVKVPTLKPSEYKNYELGGWFAFGAKGSAELSVYQMDGVNEIVSVRLSDGTYQNQNAGATRHRGLEAFVKYLLAEDLLFRIGGTWATHKYTRYSLLGKDFSGNQMSQAPKFITNAEITYKPSFIKGLRLAVEWQALGRYFMDAANTATYKGFSVVNIRAGYATGGLEFWANCINAGDVVYATTVEKSIYGTSYRPGQLRTINIGAGYYFNRKN